MVAEAVLRDVVRVVFWQLSGQFMAPPTEQIIHDIDRIMFASVDEEERAAVRDEFPTRCCAYVGEPVCRRAGVRRGSTGQRHQLQEFLVLRSTSEHAHNAEFANYQVWVDSPYVYLDSMCS